MMGTSRFLVGSSLFLLLACEGTIGAGTNRSGSGGRKPIDSEYEQAALKCTEVAPVDSPMRRLTAEQYQNAVEDLLPVKLEKSIPTSKFENWRTEISSNLIRTGDEEVVREVAQDAASQMNIGAIGCGDDACVRDWLDTFTLRAFRRPLTAKEKSLITSVYETTSNGDDFSLDDRLSMVTEAVLQMPQFVYRTEFGIESDDPYQKLTDWDVASRLSFFMWDTIPDQALLDKAAAGELHTPEQIEAEATRMVNDDRATVMFSRFIEDLLDLQRLPDASKKPEVYPNFNKELVDDAREEVQRFVADVLRRDGTLAELFTSSRREISRSLGEVYGVDAGEGWSMQNLDREQRAGLMTTAAFSLAHSDEEGPHVIQRGAFIRTELLCEDLSLPPGLDVASLSPRQPGVSERERLAIHRTDPVCASCHNKMDPAGFGLQHYDALGAYRDVDAVTGVDVDGSGELVEAGDLSGEFYGAYELTTRLAPSEALSDCMSEHLFEFVAAREKDRFDACSIQDIQEKFKASGGKLKTLMVAMTTSDAFRYRRNPALETEDQ